MSQQPPRQHVGRTVRQELSIRATPEAVWEAWARHDRIDQWFVDRAQGDMDRDAVVKWFFDWFRYELPIEVYAARRGEYLAFGGQAPGGPPALQEVLIRAQGGTTLLRIANSGFAEGPEFDEDFRGVESGWQMALATLKHWLENHSGAPRSQHFNARPLRFEYEPLMQLYATRAGLERWLATRAQLTQEPLQLASRVELELIGGGSLKGEVLARTPSELLLSWPERHGVLGLKAFKMGPMGRAIALHFRAWGLPPEEQKAVATTLDEALERLAAALS